MSMNPPTKRKPVGFRTWARMSPSAALRRRRRTSCITACWERLPRKAAPGAQAALRGGRGGARGRREPHLELALVHAARQVVLAKEAVERDRGARDGQGEEAHGEPGGHATGRRGGAALGEPA